MFISPHLIVQLLVDSLFQTLFVILQLFSTQSLFALSEVIHLPCTAKTTRCGYAFFSLHLWSLQIFPRVFFCTVITLLEMLGSTSMLIKILLLPILTAFSILTIYSSYSRLFTMHSNSFMLFSFDVSWFYLEFNPCTYLSHLVSPLLLLFSLLFCFFAPTLFLIILQYSVFSIFSTHTTTIS